MRYLLLVLALVAAVWWWLDRRDPPSVWPKASEQEARLPEPAPPPKRAAQLFDEPEPPAPVAEPEPPQPGEEVEVRLSQEPASRYLAEPDNETSAHYCGLVRQIASERGVRAVCDASLGRAAREYVYQFTEFGELVPSDVGQFLVAGSGAVTSDVSFQQVRTTSDGEAALRRAIEALVSEPGRKSGQLHVGVGEVWQPGAKLPRHIGVLGTRLGVRLDPLQAQAEPNSVWRVSGTLLAEWRGLHALALGQDGALRELPVTATGPALALEVPTGSANGPLDVQVLGEGPDGPGKLVQLRVWVGMAPPQSWRFRKPASEAHIDTAAEAEERMFALINADRRAHGLPALVWDKKLRDIAANHSADMRDRGYFSHRTPEGGMPDDRLRAAGYRAAAFAENIALDDAVAQAEQGLMHSLGHRRNLLDPKVTHVGVGASGEALEGGRYRWWLTQLFSKPAHAVDPERDADQLWRRLQALRREHGLPALERDPGLSQAALAGARHGLSGLSGASRAALDDASARGLLQSPLRAWAVQTTDLDATQLPEVAADQTAVRVGIGLAQNPSSESGELIAVLLFAMRSD